MAEAGEEVDSRKTKEASMDYRSDCGDSGGLHWFLFDKSGVGG
jgi:hypothetical protein